MSDRGHISDRAYLPEDRQLALAQGQPLPETAAGAVLTVQVTGLVRFVENAIETLGTQAGTRQVAGELDAAFTCLTAPIRRFGGHILSLADGAVQCFFPEDDGRNAVAAAQQIHQSCQQPLPLRVAGMEHRLVLKSAISVGEVRRYQLGDPDIQRLELMLGEATLRNVRIAAQLADDEILIGSEVAAALGRLVQCELASETPGHSVYRLQHLIATVPPAATAVSPAADTQPDYRPWLPSPLRAQRPASAAAELSEFCTMSTLYLRFPHQPADQGVAEQRQLDEILRAMQAIVLEHDGWVAHLGYGEHGMVLGAVFGVPGQNDPTAENATRCAFRLREVCEQHPAIASSHIGLGHGGTWAGTYGSNQRRQFGVFGREARLAKRLMQRARAGQILLTDDFARLTRRFLRLSPCGHIRLQGDAQVSPVHQAEARLAVSARRHAMRCDGSLIGREEERRTLFGLLDDFEAGTQGQVVILEGELGIGKTRLLESFLEMAQLRGIATAFTAADPVQQNVPYFAWRGLLEELAGVEAGQTGRLRRWLEQCLRQLPELGRYSSLLNDVLPMGFADSAEVRVLTPEGRALRLQTLLISIVEQATRNTPTVLVLDDAHWMDASSWQLLQQLFARIPPLLALVAQRPSEPSEPGAFDRLQQLPRCQRRRLEVLPTTEASALLCERLGDRNPEPAIRDAILQRARGNPLFIEELCLAIQEGPANQAAASTLNTSSATPVASVPETLRDTVSARIEQLRPAQQRVLMAASLIGRIFDQQMLCAIFPDTAAALEQLGEGNATAGTGLCITSLDGAKKVFFFRHALVQELAYARLDPAERVAGHRAIARWIEDHHASQLEDQQATLAHHRLAAGDLRAGLSHLNQAATHAMAIGAFAEASQWLNQLLSLGADKTLSPGVQQRAHWHLNQARALLALGQLEPSQRTAEEALALLGSALTRHRLGFHGQRLREMARQWWHRRDADRRTTPTDQHASIKLRAQLCEHLEEIYQFREQHAEAELSSLLSLNSLETLGEAQPGLVRAYSGLMLSAQVSRQMPLAEYYESAACTACLALGDSPQHLALLAQLKGRVALLRLGEGHLSEARLDNDTAIEAAQHSGAHVTHLRALVLRCVLSILRGDFRTGLRHAEEYEAVAKRYLSGHTQAEVRLATLHLRTLCLLQTDQLASAQRLVHELADRQAGSTGPDRLRIWHLHLKTELALQQGDLHGAGRGARELYRLLQGQPTRVCYRLGPYAMPAEALIRAAEDHPEQRPPIDLIRRHIQLFREFARTFGLGRARLLLLEGRFDLLLKRTEQGRAALHQSAHRALELDMPIDQAMAEMGLARSWPAGSPERREHALTAAAIFSQLQVTAEARRVERLLEE